MQVAGASAAEADVVSEEGSRKKGSSKKRRRAVDSDEESVSAPRHVGAARCLCSVWDCRGVTHVATVRGEDVGVNPDPHPPGQIIA